MDLTRAMGDVKVIEKIKSRSDRRLEKHKKLLEKRKKQQELIKFR